MELFRHYFTANEWGTSIFFQQHLNDFGFCNMDGSLITTVWNNPYTKIKYKYDLQNEVTLRCTPSSIYSYDVAPGLYPWLSSDSSYGRDWYSSSSGTTVWQTRNVTVFFIPLINKGFYLHIRSHNLYNKVDPTTTSNDTRDKTFNVNTPTPNLNIRVYGNNTMNAGGSGVLNFIGLPPSSGNPNYWTYLLYTRNGEFLGNPPTEYENYTHNLIDYGNKRVTDMPYRSEYIRTSSVSQPSSIYTNVNPNTCALIKMPFDTGYIDNLYLLATGPKELTDATFFSFNGRNFLNVFDNYVVELPPTRS